MLQRYKLRLGDGTVLAVDLDGLSIWQADRKAMVQPAGTRQWKPLKQFLAQERAAARRAARVQPTPPSTSREALPLVYPKPREEAASPKAPSARPAEQAESGASGREGRADGLPLIPPPVRRKEGPDASRRRRASAALRATVRSRRGSGPAGTPLPPPVASAPAVGPLPVEESVDLSPIEQPLLEPPLPEEPPIEPPPAEPTPVPDAPATASSPVDEDVDWMALPDSSGREPHPGAISWEGPLAAAASGPVRLVRVPPRRAAAPGATPPQQPPRPAPQEAPPRPGMLAASPAVSLIGLLKRPVRAFLALWKAIVPEAPPRPPVAPHEETTPHAAGSAAASATVTKGAGTGTAPDEVYRPRRSAADGLPALQLDPDESSIRWLDRAGQSGASEEDLPTLELDLEPLEDERPRPARRRSRR